MDRPPRDAALVTASAASVALALSLAALPRAPWLAPLALLGGLWGPGYALLRLAYPRGRLSGIERHALSAAAGLLLLPLVVVGLSLARAFTPAATAGVLAALTLACAFAARWRRHEGDEPPARAALPGTRPTLLLAGAALVVSALLLAPTFLRASPAPAALALVADEGEPIPLEAPVGSTLRVRLVVLAGDEPAAGRLVATWDDTLLADLPIGLPAGDELVIPFDLPLETRGPHRFEARWEGPGREVHATIQAVRT